MTDHPSSLDLEAFAVGEADDAVARHLDACPPCRALVDRVKALPPPARRPLPRDRRWLALAAPLALAACLLLALRQAPATPGTPTFAPPETVEPDTTFKGTMQLAVIRDRDGVQQRVTTGPVHVRPGDRLRLEVALDRPQTIASAVLGDDASWVELMPSAERPAGTHFSERAVKIDAAPTHGTILVGTPEAIARARATRQFGSVMAVRVDGEESR